MKRPPNRISFYRLFFFAAFFAGSIFCDRAFASCGCASCPIDVNTQEKMAAGSVRLDYSYEVINQDQPRIGRRRAAVEEIAGHHDEVETYSETRRLGIEAGLMSRWSIRASLPFVHVEHAHIHHHQGEDLRESWNFDGMGDLTLLNRLVVRQAPSSASPTLSLLAGGILPMGRDRIVNADGDEAETGILPSKSAYSLILGLSSMQSAAVPTANGLTASMPFFASSTYQWNGRGRDDYRMGNMWLVNVGCTYPVLPKLGFMNQINLKINRQDDAGKTNEEVEKTGGTFVYYSPGIQLTLAEGLWAMLYVQLPIYQHVNEIQLTSAYNIFGGLSYRFSLL